MKFVRVLLLSAGTWIAGGCLLSEGGFAATISATAVGSPTPEVTTETELQNGDFLIVPGDTTSLGYGFNEITSWEFDFNDDPNLSSFSAATSSGSLDSAQLTLTMTPTNELITTDKVELSNSNRLPVPRISNVPEIGETGTVEVELLDYGFTSEDILEAFSSGKENVIPFRYQDDALISSAELELTAAAPEPTTILGTSIALGLGALLKGKGQGKNEAKD